MYESDGEGEGEGGSIIRVIGFHAETQRPMKNEGE